MDALVVVDAAVHQLNHASARIQFSDRERFVLQMVEVERMRYAELGQLIGIRAETIKMVVFRARKRIFERIGNLMRPAASLLPPSRADGSARLPITLGRVG